MCVACMLQLVSIFAGGFMTLTDIYLGYIPDKMSRMSSQPSHNLKRETRILIVSITCFFYETAFVIWCNFGSILFQPSILIDVVANIFWMYDSGIFFLGGIRKQMLKMCGFVPRTNVIAVGRAPTKTLP
ncbi:hypothetical protein L596_020818 [Steinernema carpocapsae]|uniref:Uncharacterized protein n=1 Tax=Steinernema carpocapsae TaxID=34508 RepID=A0A4U5MUM2_STECR|nr:hypothetical protein L596_020818 [Steinernema carpocapsae]